MNLRSGALLAALLLAAPARSLPAGTPSPVPEDPLDAARRLAASTDRAERVQALPALKALGQPGTLAGEESLARYGDLCNHDESRGEKWAVTGPKLLFGYNWIAPLDDNVGDPRFTAKIVAKHLEMIKAGTDPVQAWMLANRDMAVTTERRGRRAAGQRPWKACVIDMRNRTCWFWDYTNPDPTGRPTLARRESREW